MKKPRKTFARRFWSSLLCGLDIPATGILAFVIGAGILLSLLSIYAITALFFQAMAEFPLWGAAITILSHFITYHVARAKR